MATNPKRTSEKTLQIDRTTMAEQMRRANTSTKKACFVVLGGLDVGSIIDIVGSKMSIGRDPSCDLVLRDDGISRRHVDVIRVDSNSILVQDLGSTNGMFVGGDKVTKAILKDGEKILLGRRTILKFVLQDELEESYQRKIYESSTCDGLTGVFNRKYFNQKMASDLSFARRHQIPFSLLMLDIDLFKSVNDTYGHTVGDSVLVSVANTISETIRSEDTLCRYGGEEFAVIAQGTDLEGGSALAERIRIRIEKNRIQINKDKEMAISTTVSLGVTEVPPGVTALPELVISDADKNLYIAKREGRNKVVASKIV